LIKNSEDYRHKFLDKLNLSKFDKSKKSSGFNTEISKNIIRKEIKFKDNKLKYIQKLARSIDKEKVFDKC
jgi:hypothetical protein